ncbi:hypothetical protein AKJ40_03580 [candidate division MSBL1 archaeon SCGC-AAA259M10]|uniref:Aldehyde ferredoxin oxidoreductase N-terminal domain-containing protein n=1 Tax=candidate division MSBL1 archaeon SCGC-AAA259M10 TaxID=1698270 RepID=A0A133UYM5_9EURY|nr:hypothetical protein AKJ40_03580 [candidate division MSBL1 archaeon SCGC-AAA259M10]
MSKIGYVDLSDEKFTEKALTDGEREKFLGGRGLNVYLLLKNSMPGVDPMSPENPLIFGAGMFSGFFGARYSVAAKSPLTSVLGESNAGGYFGPELMFSGYPHLVIKGKAEDPVYLWIHNGTVEFRDASHLWGMDSIETQEVLKEDLGQDVQIACIGQAGENLVKFACVRHGLKRSNGRTGIGAVMGSKSLKAVVVRGTEPFTPSNRRKVLDVLKKFYDQVTGTRLYPISSTYGTLYVYVLQHEIGGLSIRNHSKTYSPKAYDLEAETFLEKYKTRDVACRFCPVHCTNQHRAEVDIEGEELIEGEGPEWYLMGGFGPNLDNYDWDLILKGNDLCNRYGLDIGSSTALIGWLMELFEEGLIDKPTCDGIEMNWGNKKAVVDMLHKIAKREGIGDILAEGWQHAARKLGIDEDITEIPNEAVHAPNTKGLTIESCFDCRATSATALGEATSNRGYDHLRGRASLEYMGLPAEFFEDLIGEPVSNDISSWEGKVPLAKWSQDLLTIMDAVGICKFWSQFWGPNHLGFEEVSDIISAAFPLEVSPSELRETAERIWTVEKLFNVREGKYGVGYDMAPQLYYRPIPSGPRKGDRIDQEEYRERVIKYYEERNWDKDGIPTKSELKEVGLEEFQEIVVKNG